jgi:hypothetical protein
MKTGDIVVCINDNIDPHHLKLLNNIACGKKLIKNNFYTIKNIIPHHTGVVGLHLEEFDVVYPHNNEPITFKIDRFTKIDLTDCDTKIEELLEINNLILN